jgi:hypothetical protein
MKKASVSIGFAVALAACGSSNPSSNTQDDSTDDFVKEAADVMCSKIFQCDSGTDFTYYVSMTGGSQATCVQGLSMKNADRPKVGETCGITFSTFCTEGLDCNPPPTSEATGTCQATTAHYYSPAFECIGFFDANKGHDCTTCMNALSCDDFTGFIFDRLAGSGKVSSGASGTPGSALYVCEATCNATCSW